MHERDKKQCQTLGNAIASPVSQRGRKKATLHPEISIFPMLVISVSLFSCSLCFSLSQPCNSSSSLAVSVCAGTIFSAERMQTQALLRCCSVVDSRTLAEEEQQQRRRRKIYLCDRSCKMSEVMERRAKEEKDGPPAYFFRCFPSTRSLIFFFPAEPHE